MRSLRTPLRIQITVCFQIRDHFFGQFVDAFVVGVEFDFGEEEVSKEKAEELRKFRIAVARKKF